MTLGYFGDFQHFQSHLLANAKHVNKSARRGLTLVVAGGCDGNQTYCAEVFVGGGFCVQPLSNDKKPLVGLGYIQYIQP